MNMLIVYMNMIKLINHCSNTVDNILSELHILLIICFLGNARMHVIEILLINIILKQSSM